MNADLEATLRDLGPEYGEMVRKMRAAYEPRKTVRSGRNRTVRAAFLTAASLLLVLGLGVIHFFRPAGEGPVPVRGTPARVCSAFVLAHLQDEAAVAEILRTQLPDGGWGNAFLTRQNADALTRSGNPAAKIARKRALRNLRLCGNF